MNICEGGILCITEHGKFCVRAKEGKEEGIMQLSLERIRVVSKYDQNPFVFSRSFCSLGYVCFT